MMNRNKKYTNPLLDKYNNYINQGNNVPFENNSLINNNPHVRNTLNSNINDHKNVSVNNLSLSEIKNLNDNNTNKSSNKSIIEELLSPQKVDKKNKQDIMSDFKMREMKQNNYILKKNNNEKFNKKYEEEFLMTNQPYKNIIKDRKIEKSVDQITEADILIHKTNKAIDADVIKFDIELKKKEQEKKEILDKLKLEYTLENKEVHERNFEYSQSFIKNIPYNAKDHDDNKEEYLKYCLKKQKEAEEGLLLCDKILKNLGNDFINKNEIPF